MAVASTTLQRTIQVLSTGPSVFPQRIGQTYDLSRTFQQVIGYNLRLSTAAAYTINFGNLVRANFVLIACDSKVKLRPNGLNFISLGSTSAMATAALYVSEGSTTSLVISNPSTAFVANASIILAGS